MTQAGRMCRGPAQEGQDEEVAQEISTEDLFLQIHFDCDCNF